MSHPSPTLRQEPVAAGEGFDNSTFDFPPLAPSNPLTALIAGGGSLAEAIQGYMWECGRAGWNAALSSAASGSIHAARSDETTE